MSNLNLVLLVLATTVFLLIVVVRLRSSQPRRVAGHTVRIVKNSGKQHVLVDGAKVKFTINGVTYRDLAEIPDARVRKLAEDALKLT